LMKLLTAKWTVKNSLACHRKIILRKKDRLVTVCPEAR
jgi:hypothetical protein